MHIHHVLKSENIFITYFCKYPDAGLTDSLWYEHRLYQSPGCLYRKLLSCVLSQRDLVEAVGQV